MTTLTGEYHLKTTHFHTHAVDDDKTFYIVLYYSLYHRYFIAMFYDIVRWNPILKFICSRIVYY